MEMWVDLLIINTIEVMISKILRDKYFTCLDLPIMYNEFCPYSRMYVSSTQYVNPSSIPIHSLFSTPRCPRKDQLGLNKFCKIRRHQTINAFISNYQHLEGDSALNRQPMQLLQHWCVVGVVFTGACY